MIESVERFSEESGVDAPGGLPVSWREMLSLGRFPLMDIDVAIIQLIECDVSDPVRRVNLQTPWFSNPSRWERGFLGNRVWSVSVICGRCSQRRVKLEMITPFGRRERGSIAIRAPVVGEWSVRIRDRSDVRDDFRIRSLRVVQFSSVDCRVAVRMSMRLIGEILLSTPYLIR